MKTFLHHTFPGFPHNPCHCPFCPVGEEEFQDVKYLSTNKIYKIAVAKFRITIMYNVINQEPQLRHYDTVPMSYIAHAPN